eukprot:scaffold2251_cov139-Skeletonema_dohrnii-CCMP3373.AAC.3
MAYSPTMRSSSSTKQKTDVVVESCIGIVRQLKVLFALNYHQIEGVLSEFSISVTNIESFRSTMIA